MARIHQTPVISTPAGDLRALEGAREQCPACGVTEAGRTRYDYSPFSVVTCAACGALHLSPLPSLEVLRALYNNNYYRDPCLQHGYLDYSAAHREVVKTYTRRLSYLRRLLPSSPSTQRRAVHELGAALGHGLDLARDLLSADVSASDVSAEAVESCRRRGFAASVSDGFGVSADLPPGSIDVMYAFDVIEHLPALPAFRAWLAKVVRPGGVFFVTTPDMRHPLNRLLGRRSPSIKIPQHLSYFTTATLQRALAPEFVLQSSAWDFSCVELGLLLSRLGHVAGLPARSWRFGPALWVPNGMRMYVFQRAAV